MACYLDWCKIYKEEKCKIVLISAIVIHVQIFIIIFNNCSILVIFERTGKTHKIFSSIGMNIYFFDLRRCYLATLENYIFNFQTLLERKKTKSSSIKLGQSRSGGLVITQKQGKYIQIYWSCQLIWSLYICHM